jgi:hypothetical protein
VPFAVRLGIALLFPALLAGPADAGDTVTWRCYRNDQFTVLATEKTDSAGDKFIARRSTGAIRPDCAIESRATDRVLGMDDASYYIALRDNLLILDDGTGPDRSVMIHDLGSGKILLGAPYSVAPDQKCQPTEGCQSDDFRIDKEGVAFWRATRAEANARNCPGFARAKANGLAPTIEQKTFFRFATVTLEDLKARRCTTMQGAYGGTYILDGSKRRE